MARLQCACLTCGWRRLATKDCLRGVVRVLTNGAFPDSDDGPSRSRGQRCCPHVPLEVAAHLLLPQLSVWAGELVSTSVGRAGVPIIAVDEDGDVASGQDNIRGATRAD